MRIMSEKTAATLLHWRLLTPKCGLTEVSEQLESKMHLLKNTPPPTFLSIQVQRSLYFLPSSDPSTVLHFPSPCLLLLFHNNFLILPTAEKRRQTTPESRLTDSCCQSASIRHMYISVRKSERTHVYTHAHTNTQVKTTVSHLVVRPLSRHQPILSATTLKNTLQTLIYLFNFSDWWFFFPLKTCLSTFKQMTLTFYISVLVFFLISCLI